MSAARVRVGIILYVNRSGSTLLSRMLSDSLADVFVFPELRFTLDLLIARRAGSTVSTDALLGMMRADVRLASLGLAPERVAAIAATHGAVDLHGLMTSLATEALGRRPAAMILKLEPYVGLIAELDQAFDTPILIHALRDPRAVVRSMRATPVPEKPGFDMARGSVLYAARHWRDYLIRVDRLRPVITARYEAFAAAIPEIATALGVALGTDAGRYTVAPIDTALHARIFGAFDPTRDTTWRGDLQQHEIAMIETICGSAMDRLGYPRTTEPPRRNTRIAAELRHAIAMARHALRTAVVYASRPGSMRQIASRLRLARTIGKL